MEKCDYFGSVMYFVRLIIKVLSISNSLPLLDVLQTFCTVFTVMECKVKLPWHYHIFN